MKQENDNKMDHQATGLQGSAWIYLAQDINQLQAGVQASRGRKFIVKTASYFCLSKRTILET